jgi:hypothetical protein
MASAYENSWMAKAADDSDKKMMNSDYLQALALLAIAETLHRVAQALEVGRQRT